MTEEAAPSYSQLARTLRAMKYELDLANTASIEALASFGQALEHLLNARKLAEAVMT